MRLRFLVLVLVLAACGGSTVGATGQELYDGSCAGCHGADGSGGIGPAVGPGSNAATTLTDGQLEGVIRVGPGSMPSYSRLTDEQVRSLVRYMRLLQQTPAETGG